MFKFLWRELKGNRCSFLMGHAITPISNFLVTILLAAMVGMVYSLIEAPVDNTFGTLGKLVLATVALILTQSLGTWLYKKAAILTMNKIELKIAAKIQKISYLEYQKQHSGQWISYFTNELTILKKVLSETIADLLLPMITGLGCIVVLFCYSWEIAVFSLIAVLLGQVLHALFAKIQKKNAAAVMEANAMVGSKVNDIVSGAATIRLYKHEGYWKENYNREAIKYKTAEFKQVFTNAIHKLLSGMLGSITFVGPFIVGILLVHYGVYSIATVMFCAQLTGNLNWFFGNFAKAMATIQESCAAYERLREVLDIAQEDNVVRKKSDTDSFRIIEGRRFSAGYENGKAIIDNANFEIIHGRKIALLGESGSGKSTFLKGLMGFIHREGDLYVNSIKVEAAGIREGVARIAYVPQEMQLLGDSIKNILTYWQPNEWNIVKKACEVAEIDKFIESLPEKEDTVLLEKGDSVSKGQMQRLALARALACRPQILLLDEATSGLDALTEERVFKNICKEYPDMAIIYITHQAKNTIFADEIWRVENGKIRQGLA